MKAFFLFLVAICLVVVKMEDPFSFNHDGGVLTVFDQGPKSIANQHHGPANNLLPQNNFHLSQKEQQVFDVTPDPEFYGQFMCPKGPWIKHYGWTEQIMQEKAALLGRWQRAMEACPTYTRPAIRRYVKRHWAFEDPEWIKPGCSEYKADARNVDHQCVTRNVKRNHEFNISEHDNCGRRFKCWPQLMISHQGKMIFRPSYKAGSQSMRDMLRCHFTDFQREIWPCDNIYPNSRFTLSEEEQDFTVLHMVRHPIPRFASALIEQYTRWHNPPQKERYRLGLTKWFPLSEKNASTFELLQAFLRDTECHIDHPWWPHSATALWHMTEYEYPTTKFDGTNPVPPIDFIFKLEKFESDWKTALEELGLRSKRKCGLTNINRHDDADHVGPPKEDLLEMLNTNREMMRRVCAIYYADFVCFDYEPPAACKDMMNPQPGVCPL
eukprot:CAMPEP_0201490142 /NCGR_PEP_ID=MMETSP0151_2-20130828/25211_1 /ASSEMBLY_ACC=CAM_ASM_000257 /TAXON_ID=200890 /ORGANISM="Paramoeba atlantica, Strain 621/1 / CCAP 1560/9" /LENGTH=437 /DNA_ID=CAMNT_0047875979 /DNA_START=30 /DNA_END=1343 /DNA_ORIENTATION=-